MTIESYDAVRVRAALLDALRASREGSTGWHVPRAYDDALRTQLPIDLDYELQRIGYEIRKIP